VYNDGSGGYVTSIWTVGNTYIDSGAYDGYPWSSVSSSLDGTKIVLCANSGSNVSTDKIYIGTFTPVAPGGNFSGDKTLQIVSESQPGTGPWKVVATGPDVVSIAACKSDNGATPGEIWVGNLSYGSTTYSWVKQNMQNGSPLLGDWFSISRSTNPNQLTKFVVVPQSSIGSEQTGIWVFTSLKSAKDSQQPIACFKKDTKILTNHGYVPIQNLKKGDLVKTLHNGFVAIHSIGKKDIYNPSVDERIKDQLYVCSKEKYPEVFEDLVITGCHSILVDEFKENERDKTMKVLGEVYATDRKYRLPACVDKRANVHKEKGEFTIYHFALENENYYMNYGIYANGLLVESCSKRYLKELSNMTLL
jgi:hypothetical protein